MPHCLSLLGRIIRGGRKGAPHQDVPHIDGCCGLQFHGATTLLIVFAVAFVRGFLLSLLAFVRRHDLDDDLSALRRLTAV